MKTLLKLLSFLFILAIGILIGKFVLNTKLEPAVAPSLFDGSSQSDVKTNTDNKTGKNIKVVEGESIQEAVAKAEPGDIIMVYPGVYKETVYVDKDNIRLYGVIEKGKRPTLDGEKELNDAILYSGNGIIIENFIIKNYKGNGIMGQAGNNFIIKNNWIFDAGVYGIFPQFGKNGLIELNKLSGIEDAAIYIGMCDNIDVKTNEVYESVAGIEIENSRHCLVEYNNVYNNTGGILAFITPGLPIKTCYDVIIRNNFITKNNHKNFGAEGSIVASIPPGTGIMILAADQVIIENNFITDNKTIGILIVDLESADISFSTDEGLEPNPDNTTILDNFMMNNGYDSSSEEISAVQKIAFLEKLDIAYLGGGINNCILNKDRYYTVNLGNFAKCDANTNTKKVESYMLDNPVANRDMSEIEIGKLAYYGICSGCHSFNNKIVGPSVKIIQAIYKDNPNGIVDFITNPTHKRLDYPEMPTQKHLPLEVREAVAKYMLQITN